MKKSTMPLASGAMVRFAFYILPSRVLILLVRLYQVTLSPAKTLLFGPAGQCRFEPSCSCYAVEALKTHGALAGSWLAAKRICRCHPWGESGYDPVPVKSSQFGVQSSSTFAEAPVDKKFKVMRAETGA